MYLLDEFDSKEEILRIAFDVYLQFTVRRVGLQAWGTVFSWRKK